MPDHHYAGQTSDCGYGAPHQRQRALWRPKVESGIVDCWRCGGRIETGQPWDLGHVDGSGRRQYAGPEHRACNRRAGAQSLSRPDPVAKVSAWWRVKASEVDAETVDHERDGLDG